MKHSWIRQEPAKHAERQSQSMTSFSTIRGEVIEAGLVLPANPRGDNQSLRLSGSARPVALKSRLKSSTSLRAEKGIGAMNVNHVKLPERSNGTTRITNVPDNGSAKPTKRENANLDCIPKSEGNIFENSRCDQDKSTRISLSSIMVVINAPVAEKPNPCSCPWTTSTMMDTCFESTRSRERPAFITGFINMVIPKASRCFA